MSIEHPLSILKADWDKLHTELDAARAEREKVVRERDRHSLEASVQVKVMAAQKDAALAALATAQAALRAERGWIQRDCQRCENHCGTQESDGSFPDPCDRCYERIDRMNAIDAALAPTATEKKEQR